MKKRTFKTMNKVVLKVLFRLNHATPLRFATTNLTVRSRLLLKMYTDITYYCRPGPAGVQLTLAAVSLSSIAAPVDMPKQT